jgi:hypothetical protein
LAVGSLSLNSEVPRQILMHARRTLRR